VAAQKRKISIVISIKKQFNLLILVLLFGLTGFSIYGAFIGAERARAFFNSLPMAIFWCVLLGLLVIGFFVYGSLRKRTGLLLIHFGCVLVLAGGMYGSEKSHALMNRFVQNPSFSKGSMTLHQGQSSSQVVLQTDTDFGRLPFEIRLEEAYIEYYDEPAVYFYLSDENYYSIPIRVGEVFELPGDQGTVQVNAAYKNFKMKKQGDLMIPYDSHQPGFNPAYELTYIPKGGVPKPFFVFERFGMHAMPGQTFRAEYIASRMVKDYKSVLQVIDGGKLVKKETIEVNRPLYYRGYHFYQSTFGYDHLGPVSGISVSSVRGVWWVFGGYATIFVGLIVQLWPKLRRKQTCPDLSKCAVMDHSQEQTL
jgi:hypothetical protein